MYRCLTITHHTPAQFFFRDSIDQVCFGGDPPGMHLEAAIMGERRRLYEWALEPLYSIGDQTTSTP